MITSLGLTSFRLNDGRQLPTIGLGTFGMTGEDGIATLVAGLHNGYRLLDTAVGYGNEAEVGEAIRRSGVPASEIVVTTKIRRAGHGYDAARCSIEQSRRTLGVDQIGLYLIHWPNPRLGKYVDTWRALVDARADGEVHSIGVSNFNADHLEHIIDATGEVPAINQIELHPHFPQERARALHRRLGIQTQSWSPLGLGGRATLAAEPVTAAARRHGATPAQVVLRWHQQLGSLPIPRSSDSARQRENQQLGSLQLDENELRAITSLGRSGGRLWGGDPETEER
ncbi:MAG: oxidoreductase of aldo/keto reductase family, subgroup 1 [uncultured Chloroflexia bacterium]|uniref:Oxidoreductase of aldo/keto reductase family, subgroup 1 n=1 Tax=uncultured Chloroflexia bacterium TaxID=1672391 RepID=A0A6J4HIC7_9CHLR|nr:MAG: oxidoreductase of aldo/keto reductase family, subgroup 1 [uncultured Chloroflexia bacterium]